MSNKTHVLILGGGFGRLYAALEFEKRKDPGFEVTLISRENFFLFTPVGHPDSGMAASRPDPVRAATSSRAVAA